MRFYLLKYDSTDGGSQLGPLIRINKKYRDDTGLLAHEIEHVKQWWIVTIISMALWLTCATGDIALALGWLPLIAYHLLCKIPAIQRWVEIRCWRVQLSKYPDDRSPMAAKYLSAMYDFKISYDDALKELRGQQY